MDFINQTDLNQIGDKASVIEAFFTFAQANSSERPQELISDEGLNAEAAKRLYHQLTEAGVRQREWHRAHAVCPR